MKRSFMTAIIGQDGSYLAELLLGKDYDESAPVNLGSGTEITITSLVELIAEECGFHGSIRWDTTKPDGQPRRSLNTTRAQQFGLRAHTPFREGLRRTISWYRQNY